MNIKTILAVLAGLVLAACAEDVIDNNIVMKTRHSLTVEVTDEFAAATRADYSGFPSTSFETGDAIGIYAFDGSSYVASNIRFVRQSDGSWLPDEEIPYVEGNTYYAYFPYRAMTYTPSTSGTVDAVDTRFDNFISDASNYFWQADQSTKANFTACNLMIAKGTITDTDDDAATVKFTMKHKRGLALIDGIANRWYYTDDAGTKNSPTLSISGSSNSPYPMDGSYYFLTKPNVATSVAGNSVNIPAGKYQNIDATISGTPDYTYSLSTDNGSTFGSFNSIKPSWLTLAMNGDDFEVTTINSTSTNVSLGTGNVRNVPGDATLKVAAPVSNVDLSMVDNAGNARSSRTTANCYLIHAAGTYKIPLVYGNAIKDGSTNTLAYQSNTAANSSKLDNLVNHADQNITDPWIKTVVGTSPDGANLVWEDVQGMISAVDIDGDYLTFTVSSENIAEGNAVIAATLSGTIVWSWHIWATTETLCSDRLTSITTGSHTNLSGESAPYKVAPVNVGHINGVITSGATIYAGEHCKVRATANGVTMEFHVSAKNYTSGGTMCYYPHLLYQWGRKDPIYSSIGGYNSSGTWTNTLSVLYNATIGTNIQNPNKWFYVDYKPHSGTAYNYWDINNTLRLNVATATIKTVYDPCPPGFCVPTGNLYYWMGNKGSRSDANWNSTTQVKTWETSTYSANTSGPDLMFHAMGYRNYSNGNFILSETGSIWSASPDDGKIGRLFVFRDRFWLWANQYRCVGWAVRPVADE